jgi:hypothetical protein
MGFRPALLVEPEPVRVDVDSFVLCPLGGGRCRMVAAIMDPDREQQFAGTVELISPPSYTAAGGRSGLSRLGCTVSSFVCSGLLLLIEIYSMVRTANARR